MQKNVILQRRGLLPRYEQGRGEVCIHCVMKQFRILTKHYFVMYVTQGSIRIVHHKLIVQVINCIKISHFAIVGVSAMGARYVDKNACWAPGCSNMNSNARMQPSNY